jgi:hypothetical protein
MEKEGSWTLLKKTRMAWGHLKINHQVNGSPVK